LNELAVLVAYALWRCILRNVDMNTALVTGASSGIGYELARLLASSGRSLMLVSRDETRLREVSAQLGKEFGVPVAWRATDLSDGHGAEQLWADVDGHGVAVDVLVNCAGVGAYGEFAGQPLDVIQRMVTLNVAALTTLTRLALPGMIARRQGQILNVASLAAYQPAGPRMSVYYATKSYVLSFSKGVADELTGTGVSVTALCPGPTASAFENRSGAHGTGLYGLMPQMSARDVAAAGYHGMLRGRPVVTPGLLTKIAAFAGELPPRSLALAVNRFLLKRT
jgi:short-subunit dehydrogenase